MGFGDFFQPVRYARSTGVGSTIMGISLSVGMFITPWVKQAVNYLSENTAMMVAVIVVIAAVLGNLMFSK